MNRNLIPLVSLLACLAAFSVSAQTAKAPNIVFILIDDMGYADLSCYGSDYFETPNIDRLASEGTRFTSAYAACTVCSPTRASLMTGKYPARLHITHAIPIEGHLRRKETRYKDADYVKNMPLEEFTIAEAFKEAGYTTGFIGKWHCNWDEEYLPQYQGFDINIGGDWMGNPGDYFFPYKGEWRMTPEHPYRKWQVV
ncbi:MAG: sulfatase-like hydrolase/transferase, partial [Verrucomicrobiae bacterium]|nr:sulfatase-like hydrolase/transferase [Verrucomicrobiae bacterium]